jgi:inhibitor of KinA sporulation pathway (predicted exonuclease)
MNYIVLDLEWNQGKKDITSDKNLPFEVIEIGATKLDNNFNIVDQYGSIVKPRLYRKIHPAIRDLLNYDESVLKKGRPFDVVFREFRKWCGEDYIFCTWGQLDLFHLQQNMDYYYFDRLPSPLKYYNLQEIYAKTKLGDATKTPSLEKAVETMKIPIDGPFHSAKNDAFYTAKVFQKLSHRRLSDMYSVDCYQYPTCEEEEITIRHTNSIEYISSTFPDKKTAMKDSRITSMRCYRCNRNLKMKIHWFSNNSTQLCVGRCWNHGLQCGKIRFKNAKSDECFVIKTIEKIGKRDYEKIKKRQKDIQLKRLEKRHQKQAEEHAS